MSVIKTTLTINEDLTTLKADLQTPGTGAKHAVMRRFLNRLEKIFSGGGHRSSADSAPSMVIALDGNAVAASATATCATVIATDSVTINGVAFAAVDSGPTGNQFVRTASNTTTATNLAAAINAATTARVFGVVSATSAAAVVTITATRTGLDGNAFTLTSAGGTIAVTGSGFLGGGLADPSATTFSF